MSRALWLVAAMLVLPALPVGPVSAQDPGPLAVATLDQEALFLNSAFGRRVTRELERDRDALTAENREIEAALIAEERALIDRRAALPPAEFAPLAADFDTKVERIRTEQDLKGRRLQVRFEAARQRFLGEVGPVLTDLLRARGAQVLLDRAAVLIAVEGVDITAAAIAAIDDRLGDGTDGTDGTGGADGADGAGIGPGPVAPEESPKDIPGAAPAPDAGDPADVLQPR